MAACYQGAGGVVPLAVTLMGPESTGKTSLAEALARRFAGDRVTEHLRDWVDAHPKPQGELVVTLSETLEIALGQAAREDAALRGGAGVVFFDTDTLISVVYSEHYLGQVLPDVRALAKGRRPDLTLLLRPDVPWIADAVRDRPFARDALFDQMERALLDEGRPYRIVGGDWSVRLDRAVLEVTRALGIAPCSV